MGVRDSDELVSTFEQDYIARHPTIAPAADFELTDADYDEFKQMVLKSHFKYDALSAKQLENLEKVARFEGYYDDAKAEFEALKKQLKPNLEKDLEHNKASIKQMLTNDIVAAYYYQAGSVQNSLRTDKQARAAFELLKNNSEYRKILESKAIDKKP